MCGIVGVFSKGKNTDYTKTVEIMTKALRHRGPDSSGFYFNKKDGIYLGHRRLRIIDLSPRADQPMFNKSKSVVITYNGEIYNHKDLRKDLEEKGYRFVSECDTEVIVHGYEEYGTKVFEKLDGVFAIGLWDAKKKKLILARDRLGLKPLYFLKSNDTILFASEVSAFRKIKLSFWEKELDFDIFHLLLGFQYNFHPSKTLIKGIEKVPPASFIEISGKDFKVTKFWELPNNKLNLSYGDAKNKLHDLLFSAVEKRVLNCDVPQGVLLSGGLDSSTIAVMAAHVTGRERVKTFTAISDNKMDERKYARIVAKHIGSEHTEVFMDGSRIIDDIDEIIATYDDLGTVDPGIVSVFLLSEKIRELGIRVVLVGEGADEIFGGYSWYGLSKFPFNFVPSFVRSTLYYYILSRAISSSFFNFHRKEFHEVLNSHKGNIFDQISSFEILDQLPNHFNMKVDKGNMSHGVEPRVPYLDYKLVEFVYNLPPEYKLYGPFFNNWGAWEKRILRDIAKDYLPKEIFIRKKHGFMLSMTDTMNANRKIVTRRILENKEIITKVLDEKYLDWLLNPVSNKILAKEQEFMTWKLFLFSVWYDYYFKR